MVRTQHNVREKEKASGHFFGAQIFVVSSPSMFSLPSWHNVCAVKLPKEAGEFVPAYSFLESSIHNNKLGGLL